MTEHRDELAVRPAGRAPVHPSITERQISDLVDHFYDRVWADPRLGPIFSARLQDTRDAHLAKMKTFWSSVLLRTATYDGRPVPAHAKLKEVVSSDFEVWLGLFRPVAREVFSEEASAIVIEAAERIATSLWLAMFGTPFSNPPDWRLQREPIVSQE
jgi:hemoglobin